jgi:hypothetical protein
VWYLQGLQVNLDGLFSDLSDFWEHLEALRAPLEALDKEGFQDGWVLTRRLKGRGLRVHRQKRQEKLLIPPDLSPPLTTEFYEKMKRYSFRLFLRDLVRTGDSFCSSDLTRYCSSRVAEEYIGFLSMTATVTRLKGNRYRINRPGISSFGPTLEWFVAELFQREFACPATFGVHFKETDSGGDYDVLVLWENRLVYVEVKSSPPKSIEDSEIQAFFSRLHDLIPDLAFFFNDTHLRMKDKVIQVFTKEMGRASSGMVSSRGPEKVSDEIYAVDHWIYILNSKRDIVKNFGICLRDHLQKCRGLLPRWPEYGESPRPGE